jgi:pantoate--beta-alanine ligase
MRVLRTIAELRRAVRPSRASGHVGFVPTMGALHEGHATLFRVARAESSFVVASLFVNPRQFNDASDLAAYPRQEAQDAEMAVENGVDLIFAPHVEEIYPPEIATAIHVGGAALGYEGAHRPGHFDGVALVCVKLFAAVEPDVAYFGQKDAQQLAVIRQVVHDLNFGIEIRTVPTVRDHDGLALSSRNARLTSSDRQKALAIPRALRAGLDAHHHGQDPVAAARGALGSLDVEYVEIATLSGQPTLVIAARVGTTRLIDNVPLERPELAGL